MSASPAPTPRYNGLAAAQPTLPSRAYFGQDEFERDLAAIWQRNWIHVCRSSELAAPLSWRVYRLGTQEILIVRDELGVLRGFHNTCRHRGSQLCAGDRGRTLIQEISINLEGVISPDTPVAELILAADPVTPGCPSGVVDPVGLQ